MGLCGFGAAAHIIAQVARWQGRSVYAFTRPGDVVAQAFARGLGATWAGGSDEMPPEPLDAAIIFATVGDLVPLVHTALDLNGQLLRQRQVAVKFDSPGSAMAYCDSTRMIDAFLNLIENGAHHSPAGSTLEVALSAAAGALVLGVRAHGEAISSEALASAGSIDGSFEEREMLAPLDTAYVKFKGSTQPTVGPRYALLRKEGTVMNPNPHQRAGARITIPRRAKAIT